MLFGYFPCDSLNCLTVRDIVIVDELGVVDFRLLGVNRHITVVISFFIKERFEFFSDFVGNSRHARIVACEKLLVFTK